MASHTRLAGSAGLAWAKAAGRFAGSGVAGALGAAGLCGGVGAGAATCHAAVFHVRYLHVTAQGRPAQSWGGRINVSSIQRSAIKTPGNSAYT